MNDMIISKAKASIEYLPKLAFCFLLLPLLLFISTEKIAAQPMTMKQVGIDTILIQSRLSNSFSLKIGNSTEVIIPPFQSLVIPFSLSNYHVRNTPFIVSYDMNCLAVDSLYALALEQSKRNDVDAFSRRMKTLLVFSNDANCNWITLLTLIKFIQVSNDIPTPLIDQFVIDAELIRQQRNQIGFISCEELKNIAFDAIDSTKYHIYKNAYKQRVKTVYESRSNLYNFKTSTYFAVDFLRTREQAVLNFSPYSSFGYNIQAFHGSQELEKKFPFKKRPNYGARLSFNNTLYKKNGKRKKYQRGYLFLDYFQSPISYNFKPDSVFSEVDGFSWRFYSMGIGGEFISTKYENIKLIGEIAAISSSYTVVKLDSNFRKVEQRNTKSNFVGVGCYAQIGMSLAVSEKVELFALLGGTLFHGVVFKKTGDLPSFTAFKFGANFKIHSFRSYQY